MNRGIINVYFFFLVVISIIREFDRIGIYVVVVFVIDEENNFLIYFFVGYYLEFMIDFKIGIIKF